MNFFSTDSLQKFYGERQLFANISFGLSQGEKAALVAANGSGKSTILKIIAGLEVADQGVVTFRKDLDFAYLPQEPQFESGLTLRQVLDTAHAKISEVIARYEKALQNAENIAELEQATQLMDQFQAWDFERRLTQSLSVFGLNDLELLTQNLSGGQKKRLALAIAVVSQPQLLILDEPTNHLDIEMIEWLEAFLSQSNLTLLMVTHDRYFLDRVCNKIFELYQGKLYTHHGNYNFYLQKRAERITTAQIEADKAGKLMKKELEWVRRQPKARTTKSKARLDAFEDLKEKAKGAKQEAELKLEIKMTRLGTHIIELKSVTKKFDQLTILQNFSYSFQRGEKIGILGPNGVGKSTFLNLLLGIELPNSGTIKTGETIVPGYYTQLGISFKEEMRVIDALKSVAEVVQMANGSVITAAQLLEQFMFSYDQQYTFISKLSGGERRRLHLLMTLMKNPNLLILDEPTNDLDLQTLEKLEDFLDNFQGCLIIVSHDRYFLDNLVDHLFIFKGNGEIKDFWGNYSALKLEAEATIKEGRKQQSETVQVAAKPKPKNAKKLSYNEQREYDQIEPEIAKLESEKAKIETQLADASLSYEELQALSSKLGNLSETIDELSMRWLELDEKMNGE